MTDQPFAKPKISPALDRWADFADRRKRVGVKLERPSHIRVPTIVQAGDEPQKHVSVEGGDES